jgi:uncharacterized coiled-coil protein SlyX
MNTAIPFNLRTSLFHSLIIPSPLRRPFHVMLVALALASFGLPALVQAQDGDEGNNNTAEGAGALETYIATASSASADTAIGSGALNQDTTGGENTATGAGALTVNSTGSDNTANGYLALEFNTTAAFNTATGAFALSNNTTGFSNTATGGAALQTNTTGNSNTATGEGALAANTTGSNNTANGLSALETNRTGNQNTADGRNALLGNKTGSSNIALGYNAGANLTTGSNNIDIGNIGVAGEAAKIRIGTAGTQKATFIAGISGVGVTGADVFVSSSGQLGVTLSSARFKQEIKAMDKASEAILALKPVTFRYKHELDPDGIPQFGLVAEQVEKVNPDLVVRDGDGKVMTVRYEAVNAMLLNEFLKEHRKVQELEMNAAQQQKHFESALAKQETTIDKQQKQIAALTATVQKVSDQIALGKAAPQLVADVK